MIYDPKIHRRRSIRLKGCDYSLPGAYFVTICVQDRRCDLGQIIKGEMIHSDLGLIVKDYWLQVGQHFPNVRVDSQVVMPNHVHAIIMITEPERRGAVSAPMINPDEKILGGETPPQRNDGSGRGAVSAPTPPTGGETPPLVS